MQEHEHGEPHGGQRGKKQVGRFRNLTPQNVKEERVGRTTGGNRVETEEEVEIHCQTQKHRT